MAESKIASKDRSPCLPDGTFDILGAWIDFRSKRCDWLARSDAANPIFCLPLATIDSLARPGNAAKPVIDKSAAEAERHFATMCQKGHAVGIWNESPVMYPYLAPRPSIPTNLAKMAEFSASETSHFKEAANQRGHIFARLAGYAGCLSVDPIYLGEMESLQAQWHQLPLGEQPSFPLTRPMPAPATVRKGRKIHETTYRFVQELRQFLDKWQLTQLATWDLPWPQGPFLPNPLPAGSPAIPSQGIQNIVPSHFHVQGNDDLQRAIVAQQQETMAENGIDSHFGVAGHHQVYHEMLQIRHIEKVLTSRYGARKRGFVSLMEIAIAAGLGCSVSNVQLLRKGISSCRRGNRASVPWLRTAPR